MPDAVEFDPWHGRRERHGGRNPAIQAFGDAQKLPLQGGGFLKRHGPDKPGHDGRGTDPRIRLFVGVAFARPNQRRGCRPSPA